MLNKIIKPDTKNFFFFHPNVLTYMYFFLPLCVHRKLKTEMLEGRQTPAWISCEWTQTHKEIYLQVHINIAGCASIMLPDNNWICERWNRRTENDIQCHIVQIVLQTFYQVMVVWGHNSDQGINPLKKKY